MQQTVMIVDDALFIRAVLRGMLEELGYMVIAEAASGIDAMRMIRDHRPDIVFLDIILPDANGIEVLDDLHASHPELSVVICSSIGQESTVQKALQHGAKAYIQKPLTIDSLAAALTKIADR